MNSNYKKRLATDSDNFHYHHAILMTLVLPDVFLGSIDEIRVNLCRMNGLTGKKMQKIFRALVPGPIYNNARNLVEYCCFRFLSRDSSDIHPSLKVCRHSTIDQIPCLYLGLVV